MEQARYNELMNKFIGLSDLYGGLTSEEMKQGWHYCPDWDFLLIHPDNAEGESCTCAIAKYQNR
jgi:hypothetical protein